MPLLSLVPRREGRRASLKRLSRWGDCSRQPPLHAPYHCPISVPSYFGSGECPPTVLWKHRNRDPQPSLPQTILVLGSPLSPPPPHTSFSTTSEHTMSPGSGKALGQCLQVFLSFYCWGLVPSLSTATQESW